MSLLTAAPAHPNFPTTLTEKPRPSSAFIPLQGTIVIGMAAVLLAVATAMECRSITHFPSLLYGLVLWGWWGIIASVFWFTGFQTPSALHRSFARIALHVLIACVAGVVHLMLLGSLSLFIPEWETQAPALRVLTHMLSLNRFGFEILIYGFLFGLIGVIHAQMRAQRDALQSLELQRQLSAAQLKALQMQLEPHFLFNTLNAITTLVELGRQAQAAEMLRHLNVILKRTLERSTPEKVPLAQELEIVENYLAIEQVRFADRLRVDIRIDPGALNSLVPCFLLQPIVENAIRHGIASSEGEGTVVAQARRHGDRLRITVRDSGPGLSSAPSGNGIGLKNTRERLAYFYPERHLLHAGPLQSGGFEVALDVPYESAG
jgi:signal transduction histidine kinase